MALSLPPSSRVHPILLQSADAADAVQESFDAANHASQECIGVDGVLVN